MIAVNDGDTLTIAVASKERHLIRLAGIDAPEYEQAYGKASRKNLSDLVAGQPVTVEWTKRDAYGRIIGKIWVRPPECVTCSMTRDVSLAQLEAGLAWWNRAFKHEQTLSEQGYYEYAEFDAKSRRIGLWADPAPMPPWEWRKKKQWVANGTMQPLGALN